MSKRDNGRPCMDGYQPRENPNTIKKGYQPTAAPSDDGKVKGGYQPPTSEGGNPTNNPPGED